MNDYAVIGTGIVGLATAYHLRQKFPDASILMIDKEMEVAFHQSSRNSGVIHSGIYYTPGSLKAQNCILGYSMMLDFCKKHQIDHDICGKIIIATNESELTGLKNIFDNGLQNGLTGLRWLDEAEIREREPHIVGHKAIHVPQAGIINFGHVAKKLEELLITSHVHFQFNSCVTDIKESDGAVHITTSAGNFQAKQLITCGGLYADKLARMTGTSLDCQILPFRGEYYKFRTDKKQLINHLVYPVPNTNFPFLGLHFTRTINGDIEAGPNAVLAFAREGYHLTDLNLSELIEALVFPGFRKLAYNHMSQGINEMKRSISKAAFVSELRKMMPELNGRDLIKVPSGVRAQAIKRDGTLMNDYYFYQSRHILHVINAPSPAATSSLAIGAHIVKQLPGVR